MSEKTNVLIADDHVLIGEAVAQTLERTGNFTSTIVRTFKETHAALLAGKYDLILLDVMMPGMEGLSSITRVLKVAGEGRVVVFSGNVNSDFAQKAIAEGAAGFIPKTLPLRSLTSALSLIESGQIFFPIRVGEALPAVGAETSDDSSAALTKAQIEVLRLVQAGRKNKEIARVIGVSEAAIKMHLRSIFAKLGARNRVQAVMAALVSGAI